LIDEVKFTDYDHWEPYAEEHLIGLEIT